jgi:ArsR family transcriptional regulator, zinc-responsive transcriptional repressor
MLGSKMDSSSQTAQDRLTKLRERLAEVAFVVRSLSDENRLRILLTLSNGKKTVSKIVEEVDLSQSLVSHHLKELRRSLVVRIERKGLFVYYEIADQRVMEVIEILAALADDLLANRKNF